MKTALALLIILLGAYFMARRVEVRLVLALCALALFVLAGRFFELFGWLAREMTNDKTVVPICSAMGFAYVLKSTGCDRHLVELLVKPLRFVRPLLIPGGVAVGYLVNTAIVSQSSTAATVGTVMVPLLIAAGLSPLAAGSILLLGASMGGELFNPGAVEIVTLDDQTALSAAEVVRRVMPFNLIASITALAVFWWLTLRWERRQKAEEAQGISPEGAIGGAGAEAEAASPLVSTAAQESLAPDAAAGAAFRIQPLKAMVPFIPLALLFILPHFVAIPKQIVIEKRVFDGSSVFIAASMLAGVAAAALTAPRLAGRAAEAFFEGAGFAYTHIISLIITATMFVEGIKANGLIEKMALAMAGLPALALAASVLLPGVLATATGSGIAPAVAFIKAVVPLAQDLGIDPMRLGALAAVSAQLGRTMSPVAAVVMMSATLTGCSRTALSKRVMPALAAGAAVMLIAALLGLV